MKAALAGLRWSILGALLLAVLGVAVALHGVRLHQDALAAHAQVRSTFLQSQQRLGSVYVERQEIDTFLARYNALGAMGALDDERRLEWVERLTAIRDDLRLPNLTYSVAPRLPHAAFGDAGSGLVYESSRMQLAFALFHEGDLVQILKRLREPPMGVPDIDSCSMTRRRPGGGASVGQIEPALEGSCLIDWITLTGGRNAGNDDKPGGQP